MNPSPSTGQPQIAFVFDGERAIQDRFEAFHREHPEVMERMVLYAREAKSAGMKTYGVKALMERLRWHYRIERRDGEFKLNNNMSSRYARLIMAECPDLAGFFELRELKTE